MNQRQHHFHDDQDHYHELQHLRPVGSGLIGQDLINTLDHFQLSLDAVLPIVEVKARGQLAVDAGQVLIAHQLKDIAGSLKKVVSLGS